MEALRATTYRSPTRFGRQFSGASTLSISSSSTSSSSTTSSSQTPPPGKPYKFAPLSTPSPSAGANGCQVDVEIEKLRRLSQEFARKSDDEDFSLLNGNIGHKSRSLSPKATSPPDNSYKHVYNNNNNNSYNNSNYFNNNVNGEKLSNGVTEGGNNKFHYKRARSPLRDNTVTSVLVEKKKEEDPTFLTNTFPDLLSYKMPSQRRFSEENFRRPLATLHEDQVMARRRFSEDVRKKSLDTSGVMDDVYNHQRRLSEAGLRRLSDASIVLTEETDSFIIGNRVWVGGTKGGVISYIGDTQFAPGEWAGVTLDEPIGKNDGSVGGIRYFQCEAKKGVFSRLTRLSREPLTDIDIEIRAARSVLHSDAPKTNGIPVTPACKVSPAPPSRTTSIKTSSPSPLPTPPRKTSGTTSSGSEPKIGDRVVVASAMGGVRHGCLRFIGHTDFADGIWAGVELDEPTGKNDGSVAGKKYFSCRDKYGLFAPLARVSKFGSGGGTTPRRSTSTAVQTPRVTVRRSTSRESLGASSVASSTASSSVRGSRVRLGVTSLTQRPSKPSPSHSSLPSTKAMQEALAEKAQHVEQLLRERDIERTELACLAAQADEATRAAHDMKAQLDKLQEESEERLHDCGERIRVLEREREDLVTRLDDRQRDFDDISFRLEEEAITKADLESQSTTDEERIKKMGKELEEARKKVKDRGREEFEAEELEISLRASVEELQARVMELEKEKEDTESLLEKKSEELLSLQISHEALKNTVSEREQKIQLLDSSMEEDRARSSERSTKISIKESEIAAKDLEISTKVSEISAKDMVISSKDSEIVAKDSVISAKNSLISERDNVILELERGLAIKTREVEDGLETIQEVQRDQEKGRAEKEALRKEMKEIRDQLESGSGEATTLIAEVSKLKEELRVAAGTQLSSTSQITKLEGDRLRLEGELEAEHLTVAQCKEEMASSLSQRDTQIKDIKVDLEARRAADMKEAEAKKSQYKEKLLELEKELSCMIKLKEKASQNSQSNESLVTADLRIESLESQCCQLQEQVDASHSSGSDATKQLATLSRQLEDINKKMQDKESQLQKKEKQLLNKAEEEKDKDKQLQVKDKLLEDKEKQLEDVNKKMLENEKQHKDKEKQLKDKNTELEEMQAQINKKEAEITKEKQVRTEDKETESKAKEKEKKLHEEMLEKLKQKVQETKKEAGKRAVQVECLNKQHHMEQEELVKKKDLDMYELQEQLMMKEGEVSELAGKMKSLEVQVTAMTSDASNKQGGMEATLAHLTAERNQLAKEKEVATRGQREVEGKMGMLEEEHLKLRTEREENLLAVTQRDQKVLELKEEVKSMMVSFSGHREDLQKQLEQAHQDKAAMAEFQKTFEGELECMNELQKSLTTSEEEKDNLEMERKRLEEEITILKGIEEEKSNLVKEKDRLEEVVRKIPTLEGQCTSLKEEKRKAEEDIKAKMEELKTEREQWVEKQQKLETDIRSLRKSEEERTRLGGDVLRLETELTKMTQIEENNITLSTELEKIGDERQILKSELSSMGEELKIKTLLEEDNLQLSSELKNKAEEIHNLTAEFRRLKELEANQLEEKIKVKALEEEKRSKLQEEEKKLKQIEVDKRLLESKNKSLEQDMEELKISLERRVGEVDQEKFNLVEEVVSLQDQLSVLKIQTQEDGKKTKEALEAAETTGILRRKVNLLETEKRRLESKIVDLQVERASTEITNNDSDSFVKHLKEEKNEMEGQVNFLNSIIVDMQRKNDDLKTRIEILELGNIPDDTKANMNGIRLVAPRLFCDICDIFDAHDTEDCPCQATSDSPPPSLHHGQRDSTRPYCDSCEVFGHEMGHCSQEETF